MRNVFEETGSFIYTSNNPNLSRSCTLMGSLPSVTSELPIRDVKNLGAPLLPLCMGAEVRLERRVL